MNMEAFHLSQELKYMRINLKAAKDSQDALEDQKMALAFEVESLKKQVHAQAVEIVRLRKLLFQERQVPRATSSGTRRPRSPLPPGPIEPEAKTKKLATEHEDQNEDVEFEGMQEDQEEQEQEQEEAEEEPAAPDDDDAAATATAAAAVARPTKAPRYR